MDTFPETFNRKTCIDKMTVNQKELIKDTRETFYKIIMTLTEECNPIMILDFPDRLWHDHKATLTRELLERFGKLKVKIINPQAEVTKTITDIKDFPNNVKRIIIEFSMDDD